MTMNKMHVIHMLISFIYWFFKESVILVSGMPKVCEYIDGCAKQFMCDLAIYLMTVLLSSYVIIRYPIINAIGHVRIVVDGLNATEKCYFTGEMELIRKLVSNNTTHIEILPSVSKDASVKFVDQFIHILNNKERLNEIKGITKCKRENHFSNINGVYKMFKVNLILVTEV